MLRLVLLYLLPSSLIGWDHATRETHPSGHVLALVDHVTLKPLVAHRLIEDLLDVHRATHLLLLVHTASLYLASLHVHLRHLI